MNAPDGALAVLEFHARGQQSSACSYPRLRSFDELAQARVAFAELIEAIKALRACAGDEGADPGSVADMRLDHAKRRVDVALARVQGLH